MDEDKILSQYEMIHHSATFEYEAEFTEKVLAVLTSSYTVLLSRHARHNQKRGDLMLVPGFHWSNFGVPLVCQLSQTQVFSQVHTCDGIVTGIQIRTRAGDIVGPTAH